MSESKFYDCWGRELEAQTCEYCGVTKPISHWNGIEGGRNTFYVLMVEYVGRGGRKSWKCNQCSDDIKNKLEGKAN